VTPLGDLTVDLALYVVPGARLVLRRTVSTVAGPAVVEELWASDEMPASAVRLAARAALDTAAALLLAEPVATVPGLHPPTHRGLDDLAEPATVTHLAGCRTTVRGRPGPGTLCAAEVVGGRGVAAHVARTSLLAAVGAHGLVRDGAPAPAGPPDPEPARSVRDELLADLADARTRLEEVALWRRVAGAPLGGWYRTGPDRFRLTRRMPGPATLTTGLDDPDLDGVLVTFLDGGPAGATTLVGYRLDPRVDPESALGGPEAVPTDHRTGPRVTPTGVPVPALHGTVVVHDSHGLPAGNRLRQFATTVHVRTPGPDATALLQARPEIVRAVVEHACAVEEPAAAALQNRLADAVCGPDPSDPGGRITALLGDDVGDADPGADPLGRVTRSLTEIQLVGNGGR
jgi:hypothetical protein